LIAVISLNESWPTRLFGFLFHCWCVVGFNEEQMADVGPSAQSVGREFVRQYYTMLNERPDCLHRFVSCSVFTCWFFVSSVYI